MKTVAVIALFVLLTGIGALEARRAARFRDQRQELARQLELLTESEWLEAVQDENFESEEGLRRTLSSIRAKAKNKFGKLHEKNINWTHEIGSVIERRSCVQAGIRTCLPVASDPRGL